MTLRTPFIFLLGLVARMIDSGVFHASIDQAVVTPLQGILNLVTILPLLGVGARRLHDTGRSGWWWWILLVPLIGAIVLLVFMVLDSQPGDNEYGPNPKAAAA